jgi:hypothetical protein
MAAERQKISVETDVVERFQMARAVRWHERFAEQEMFLAPSPYG